MSCLAPCQGDARTLSGHRRPVPWRLLWRGGARRRWMWQGVRGSGPPSSKPRVESRGVPAMTRVQEPLGTSRGLRETGLTEWPREAGQQASRAIRHQDGGSQGNRTTISGPGIPRGLGELCVPIGSRSRRGHRPSPSNGAPSPLALRAHESSR